MAAVSASFDERLKRCHDQARVCSGLDATSPTGGSVFITLIGGIWQHDSSQSLAEHRTRNASPLHIPGAVPEVVRLESAASRLDVRRLARAAAYTDKEAPPMHGLQKPMLIREAFKPLALAQSWHRQQQSPADPPREAAAALGREEQVPEWRWQPAAYQPGFAPLDFATAAAARVRESVLEAASTALTSFKREREQRNAVRAFGTALRSAVDSLSTSASGGPPAAVEVLRRWLRKAKELVRQTPLAARGLVSTVQLRQQGTSDEGISAVSAYDPKQHQ